MGGCCGGGLVASMPGDVMFLRAVPRKTMVETRKSEIHPSFSFKGDAQSVSKL